MKKPFVVLSKAGDYFKLLLCIILCISALYLFCKPEQSIAVFSDGGGSASGSLYGFLGSCL